MKYEYSSLNIFFKITMFLNIVILIVGAFFIIGNNKNLMTILPTSEYLLFMENFNRIILFGSIFFVFINGLLLILSVIYSRQKYFKLLEKIDFNSIESSLELLKKMPSLDEIGYMGKKIKSLLEIYLQYSYLKKHRIDFEQTKFNIALNFLEKGALVLVKENQEDSDYKIKFINVKGLELLSLSKRSMILGKSFYSILHPESVKVFQEYINDNDMDYDKSMDIFETAIELDLIELRLRMQTNISAVTERNAEAEFVEEDDEDSDDNEIDKTEKHNYFTIKVVPFILRWPSELEALSNKKNEVAKNSILDSILILFEKRSRQKKTSD